MNKYSWFEGLKATGNLSPLNIGQRARKLSVWQLFNLEGKQLEINEDISHFGTGIGKRSKCLFYNLRLATDKVQTKPERSVDLTVMNEVVSREKLLCSAS